MHALHLDIIPCAENCSPWTLLRNVRDVLWNGPVWPVPPRTAAAAAAAGALGINPVRRELTFHSFSLLGGNRFYTGPLFQSRMGWFSPPFLHIWSAFSTVDSHYKLKLSSRKLEQAHDIRAHQGKRRQNRTLTLRIVLSSRFYLLESAIK
jgi:hypothetical protein